MRTLSMMILLTLAWPNVAVAETDDPCHEQAGDIAVELASGPAGELTPRERGLVLAAASRGCQAERMRIAEIALSPPAPAPQEIPDPAPAMDHEKSAPSKAEPAKAETVGFMEGLQRWLKEPTECERIRRANGRIVSKCE